MPPRDKITVWVGATYRAASDLILVVLEEDTADQVDREGKQESNHPLPPLGGPCTRHRNPGSGN